MRTITYLLASISLLLSSAIAQTSPISTFDQAKIVLNDFVYHDRRVTTYCGCDYSQYARTGGRVDHGSCGYVPKGSRADAELRAARIEYEHIMPISKATEGRPCGTRANCRANDTEYNLIEADPHNLTPIIGEINALRSNFDFAELSHINFSQNFGQCDFKIDRNLRLAEPADEIKGFIARTYFYMAWAYGSPIPVEMQQMLLRWNEEYPANKWEIERNQRIAKQHGWDNPYISGKEKWTITSSRLPPAKGIDALESGSGTKTVENRTDSDAPAFIGNRNSGIYFPQGCTWYSRVGLNNRVPFNTANEAQSAGFRAARNC